VRDHLSGRFLPAPTGELPIIVGGYAKPRSVSLAARFADEYNTVMPTLEQIRERRAGIVAACEQSDREPIAFSVMTTTVIGGDEAAVRRYAQDLGAWRGEPVDLDAVADSWLVGTVEQVAERLGTYAEAGVERIYLQHLLHRDLDTVELIGRELVPALT
jgi:alkanesulfonate monooxygenase SsuD/methylene tetrahydromethanopterin reductase-like flavin-dependent oxidoreductase (luciferase family)